MKRDTSVKERNSVQQWDNPLKNATITVRSSKGEFFKKPQRNALKAAWCVGIGSANSFKELKGLVW
jgi:hypothetical protein